MFLDRTSRGGVTSFERAQGIFCNRAHETAPEGPHVREWGEEVRERQSEKQLKQTEKEERSYVSSAMDLRSELLKSIWYAFTALDIEKSGKVSKSQLKVSCWSTLK